MFSSFERFVAFRYLFSARREGFVSVIAWFSFLGVALGVATLIVVMAVMNGFRQELFGKLVAMRGHVTVQSAIDATLPENKEQLALIKSVPGVRLAYPMLEKQAIAMAKIMRQASWCKDFPLRQLQSVIELN